MPRAYDRLQTIRNLDNLWLTLECQFRKLSPPPGTIPAGGGDWMDLWFRMEGIAGVARGLRDDEGLLVSIQKGREASTAAVQKWNARREWQVHRWENTAHDYILRQTYKAAGLK